MSNAIKDVLVGAGEALVVIMMAAVGFWLCSL